MQPGDRVTFKYDKRICYGTVIERQFRESKNKDDKFVFVVWDKTPNTFSFYKGEIRKIRLNEEENFPKEVNNES